MMWIQANQKMGATTGKEGEAKMGPGEVKRIDHYHLIINVKILYHMIKVIKRKIIT